MTVHFHKPAVMGRDLFSRKCGGCHRMLTMSHGGIGTGNAGPNLSGLLTGFGAATAPDGHRWDVELLRKWLDNPRSVRPWALMRPVPLTAGELREMQMLLRETGKTAEMPKVH